MNDYDRYWRDEYGIDAEYQRRRAESRGPGLVSILVAWAKDTFRRMKRNSTGKPNTEEGRCGDEAWAPC